MLCDELVAAGRTAEASFHELLPKLKAAQKFVLDPEFAAVAEALADDYTGLVRVFDHCRLPYHHTWVEWAQADRPRFNAAGVRIPQLQLVPRRVGVLMSASKTDLSAWKAHLFWNTDAQTREDGQSFPPMLSIAMMAMVVDMTAPIHALTMQQLKSLGSQDGPLRKHYAEHPGWANASDEIRLKITNHTAHDTADIDWPELVAKVRRGLTPTMTVQDVADMVLDLAGADWAGETAYMLAVVGLLNARNAVETVKVDRSKMNKSRKRAGKFPMFDHHVLKIHRRVQARVPNVGVDNHRTMRQHFTRGHFKSRRTGIFFWSPHLRGDPSKGTVTKTYEVME